MGKKEVDGNVYLASIIILQWRIKNKNSIIISINIYNSLYEIKDKYYAIKTFINTVRY